MGKENLWPDIDDSSESTSGIYAFIKDLKKDMEKKYKGVIRCSFDKITYASYGLNSTFKNFSSIKKLVGPQECKGDSELNKKELTIPEETEFKFLISNNNYFFRVFDVKMSSFFPVEIKPSENIDSNRRSEYEEVLSLEDFKEQVQHYIQTKYVKDMLRYLLRTA